MSGFPNRPKIIKGAFVEFGLSLPPLFVVFQFNPEQLTRSRSLSFGAPGEPFQCPLPTPVGGSADEQQSCVPPIARAQSLRDYHQGKNGGDTDLLAIQDNQLVSVQEETISFDIRLDATDDLSDNNAIAKIAGLHPQLATLELMVHPKGESVLGGLVDDLLGLGSDGFSFTKKPNPPINLFIFGAKRVLPVNIGSLSITETEFNTNLDPIRATAAVTMSVIEGKNIPYTYSKVVKEAMSVLNLANIADIANVVVPG